MKAQRHTPRSLALTAILSMTGIINLYAADRYWISGSTGNWSDLLNWSTVSGGQGGASLPGNADTVYFDNNGTGDCNIDTDIDIAGIKIQTGYNGTITQNTYAMTIGIGGYEQNSGIFAAGAGNIEIESFFKLSGGSYTAPSGNLSLNRNWGADITETIFIHSGGTFNHNNGTVVFNMNIEGWNYWVNALIDILPATEFYDVISDCNSSWINSPVLKPDEGDVIKILHNFTHDDGFLEGNWKVGGDLYVNTGAQGNHVSGATSYGDGNIFIIGNSTQEYYYSGTGKTVNIIVDKPSGEFRPADGTTDFSSNGLEILSGTFIAPAGTYSIGSTFNDSVVLFTQSGGSFNATTGTIMFEPINKNIACPYPLVFTINAEPGTVFNNLTVNASGTWYKSQITSMLGKSVNVSGDCIFNNGILSGNWNMHGGFIIDSAAYYSDAAIIFAGTGDQSITTNLTEEIRLNGNIEINKPSGNLIIQSSLVLDEPGQQLILDKGNIITTSYNLMTIGKGVNVLNASDSSFIAGPVKKTGNEAFTFPTGDGTEYRPISISAPQNTDDAFVAEFHYTPQNMGTELDDSLAWISDCEYWTLERTAGTSDVHVTLSWDENSCGIDDPANLRVAGRDGSLWNSLGNAGTTGDQQKGTIGSVYTIGNNTAFALGNTFEIPIIADAGPDITIESGETAVIGSDPVAGYSYKWIPTIGLDDPLISKPAIALTNRENQPVTLQYVLIMTASSTGLSYTDTVAVTINPASPLMNGAGFSMFAQMDTTLGDNDMVVYDRFGNTTKLQDITVKDIPNSDAYCTAGFFRLTFQDVLDDL
ncbi:MAG: hypothetical protein KJ607_02860, partial [Bacteroidetes bacterium]|nr:hypothetical protein [Bacteroidota bacterium]